MRKEGLHAWHASGVRFSCKVKGSPVRKSPAVLFVSWKASMEWSHFGGMSQRVSFATTTTHVNDTHCDDNWCVSLACGVECLTRGIILKVDVPLRTYAMKWFVLDPWHSWHFWNFGGPSSGTWVISDQSECVHVFYVYVSCRTKDGSVHVLTFLQRPDELVSIT